MCARGVALAAVDEPASTLPEQVVTATRERVPKSQLPFAVDEISAAELSGGGALTLDDALGGSAAFGLFRRSGSLTAHPTAQGVSLRNIGPSGASRSLALLDGVPLNDPFGGWVAWSKIPRLNLRAAEIVRGGGSGAWGSAALGGVVQLLSRERDEDGAAFVEFGDYGTHRAEATGAVRLGEGNVLRVGGRWFETDGFFQYAPAGRGPIDRRLDSRHTLVHADLSTAFGDGWRLDFGARAFDEERGNGTPFQRNESKEQAAHARLGRRLRPGLELRIAGYGQSQSFASRFSAVDEARANERPALDQFKVPATAFGLSAVLNWAHGNDGRARIQDEDGEPNPTAPGRAARTTFGLDFRSVRGETREAYLFSGDAFQRRRFAGGSQRGAGLFVQHGRELVKGVRVQAGLRLDHWRDFDGHRHESIIASGETTRDERFDDRSGWQSSPSLGVAWQATPALRARASAYRAFRAPTLNERYRPFRVGDVATDANPALSIETLDGAEVALDWSRGGWSVSAGVFESRLDDAVANVTLSTTDTLVQRRRENLDRVRVRGLELRAGWAPAENLRLAIDCLISDARVRKAAIAPGLEGKRLPQAPREVVTARMSWRISDAWRAEVSARALGSQFEDDENTLVLPSATVVDLILFWRINPACELHLALDNAAGEALAVSLNADGRSSYGTPR
ncbi:MAG: TonB-dependent receptor, partial [Opitutaceae bacterium]